MNNKLIINVIVNVSYNLISIIVPFITAPYLGRILGAEQIGTYTYIYTISSYFVIFGLLGISNHGTRSIAKVRENKDKRSKKFWELYSLQFFSGIIVSLIYLFYSLLFTSNYKLIFIIMSFYVFTSFTDITWYFAGQEKFKNIVFRSTMMKIINLFGVFIFVRDFGDLIPYTIVMSLNYLVGQLVLWPSLLNDVSWIKPKFTDIVSNLKPNFLLFIPTIAATIYQMMDKIMIGALASSTQLAYYEYAEKLINIPNVIFGAIGAVMLSRISNLTRMGHQNNKEVKVFLGYSMDLSILIATASAFGLAAIADELVLIYYGSEFMRSSIILFTLTPTILFYSWSNVLRMQYVIPNNKDIINIGSTFFGAIVNIILNLFLIPTYGALGAAIGTVIAQIVVAFCFSIAVKDELPLRKYFCRNIPIIISGFFMFIVIKLIQKFHAIGVIELLLDIFIGAIIFIVATLVTTKRENIHLVRTVWNLINKK